MSMEDLHHLDRRHLWHPFTQHQEWSREHPLIIARAEGNTLIDVEGRRYLDAISSLWVTVHGHRKPALDAAVRAQLDKVAHCTLLGQASVPSIELAAKLSAVAPAGLTRVFYSDSGSTSVEGCSTSWRSVIRAFCSADEDRSSSPVCGLSEKWGRNEDRTSTRSRWPARNRLPVSRPSSRMV